MNVVALLVTAGCFVAPVSRGSSAQVPSRPDFSGEWVLVTASGSTAEHASALTVRQTVTRTTMRGEPMTPWFSRMTVVRRFKSGAVSETRDIGTIGATVPGIPVGGSSPQGEWTTMAVDWRGKSLVIKTTKSSQPPGDSGSFTAHEEVWSLDRKGRLVIAATDRGATIKTTTVQLVYRRQ